MVHNKKIGAEDVMNEAKAYLKNPENLAMIQKDEGIKNRYSTLAYPQGNR